MLLNDTDLEPCDSLIHSEFGRLMPIGVEGALSPASPITVITFAEIPFTVFFLCTSAIGE